jgi:glycosyltransferase involved in cell wall biosynthesis
MSGPEQDSTGSDPQEKLLILAYYYPPRASSGAARPARFTRYLRRLGCETQVIAGPPGAPVQPAPGVRYVPDASVPVQPRTACFARILQMVQRFLLPFNESLPWAAHAWAEAAGIVTGQGVSAVLSTSPPISTHLVALRLKSVYGVRWIADFRDPLFGNPFRHSWRSDLYLEWLERKVMSEADVVIANTEPFAEVLRNRYPHAASKITVIWNGYDPEDRLTAAPLPPRDYKVLVHTGSIYGGRRPDVLLESLNRLVTGGAIDPSRFHLQLVGHLERSSLDLPAAANLISRGCLEYTGEELPREKAHQILTQSDSLLLLDLNSTGVSLQVPGKLFEYICVGRPILAFTRRGSPVESILERCGIPHETVYPDASPEKLDAQLISFLSLPAEPVEPSEWFLRTFSGAAQAEQLMRLI